MSTVSEFASNMLLLTRWQSLAAENRSRKVKGLLVEAQKSFRLAKGIANIELTEELETISQHFQKEAEGFSSQAAGPPPTRSIQRDCSRRYGRNPCIFASYWVFSSSNRRLGHFLV